MPFFRVIQSDPRDRLPLPSGRIGEYSGLPNMAMARSASNTPSHLTTLLSLEPTGGAFDMIIQPGDGCKDGKTKRVNPSKKLRFDVFKRDRFTCQYCGAQPPGVVLEVDHIHPVVEGGKTSIDNLITACEPCNRGKGKRVLGDRAIRPDADILYLQTLQEIGELKRFQEAERQRDEALMELAEDLQDRWVDVSGDEYAPATEVLVQMLRKYSPEVVNKAVLVVAKKQFEGHFGGRWRGVISYLWGTAKRISEQMEVNGGES
jgi:hypothetical protein